MRPILATVLPLILLVVLAAPAGAQDERFGSIVDQARELAPLETLIVAQGGEILIEEGFGGHSTDEPANIKSASKSVISALVGIAIDRGLLDGPDQKIAPILKEDLPEDPDRRIHDITIGHLLSMQAGLGRTSGPNYGRWVSSGDWVRAALARPFADDPGGGMLYSTGSTHLLSAILTEVGGRSTLELAHDWLEPVEDFAIASWERGPEGVYLGGNQMAMAPRSLLAFGELYRSGGMADGTRVISREWIEASWEPRTRSVYTGDGYGYGWFLMEAAGRQVRYAWGYGGQMLYIVPSLDLTVVMTSTEDEPSAGTGYRDALHDLLADIIVAVEQVEG